MMRCLTVAQELAELQGGAHGIRFVCADRESAALADESGFRSYVLGTDYRSMESELPWWEARLRAPESRIPMSGGEPREACGAAYDLPGREIILVDSYYVTDAYLAALRSMAYVALMDDMGMRRYPADCVVNYNAPADEASYRELYKESGTRLLIGSRYVPLRRQFWQENAFSGDTVREVLITAGGGDSENIAGNILERIYSGSYFFHVVSGPFHPCLRELEALGEARENIQIHRDVKDMAGLMRRCQAAVTAGGSTIYELAALGVPFICFSYAENQEALTEYVGRKGIAGFAGAWHKGREETLEAVGRLFEELTASFELRAAYGEAGRRLTDGRGARRLARALLDRM